MFPKVQSDQLFLSCYHDDIKNRDQLYDLMNSGHGDGSYIVRNSLSECGRLVLSVKHYLGVVHVKIDHCLDKQTFSLGKKSFQSIDQLLDHFSKNPIDNEEKISGVILRRPIPKIRRKINDYIQPIDPYMTCSTNSGSMASSTTAGRHCSEYFDYLKPDYGEVFVKGKPTAPPIDRNTKPRPESCLELPRGRSVVAESMRKRRNISLSGTEEERLPNDIRPEAADNQKQVIHKMLSTVNSMYVDMNKTNTR